MFYSQFILAKKGPLGTIWIAAHLERKLRKNQVADTDIGVSVDSILFPEVPIALRLSSHLLLGVVRIYSRKVNYLFDDCSEALLKVKQAFRSTAVDLPPEQSKAPYHSITLPETFDLDDFEIPDNETFQGNYVDHHVSTREQITLQDTMDGVAFPTSQFGPDERFGDGDAYQIGLDLDEELFLDKGEGAGTSGVLMDMDGDPQACVKGSSPSKVDDHNEGDPDPSLASPANHFSIQAPSTPGLMEGPNLPSAQEALVSDDHMDEDHNPSELAAKDSITGLMEEPNLPSAQEALVSDDHMDEDHNPSDLAAKEVCGPPSSQPEPTSCGTVDFHVNGNCHHQDLQESEKARPLGAEIASETMELISTGNALPFPSNEHVEATNGLDAVGNNVDGSSVENERDMAADIHSKGHSEVDDVGITKLPMPLPDIASVMEVHSCAPYAGINKANLNGMYPFVSDTKSENDKPSVVSEVPSSVSTDRIVVSSGSEPHNEGQPCLNPEIPETFVSDIDKRLSARSMPVLQACNSHQHACNRVDSLVNASNILAADDGLCSMGISGREDSTNVSGISTEVPDAMKSNLNADQTTHQITNADNNYYPGKLDNKISGGNISEVGSIFSDLAAPEKLLSVPSIPAGLPDDLFVKCTPAKDQLEGDGDATLEKTISGWKRSYTESTLTIQSLNSAESLGAAQSKRSVELVPEEDDLLSSILVGRKSTTMKMKPTPPVTDTVPAKRRRAVRSSSHKRKVLVDDAMVLHGDTIRQQLTGTEDIRRVRKKAPCTRLEIWMLQKQFMEDEIFSEPVFTGMSAALISLHSETFDLSRTTIVDEVVSRSGNELDTPAGTTFGEESENLSSIPSAARDGCHQDIGGNLGTSSHQESMLGVDGSSQQIKMNAVGEVIKEGSEFHASGEKLEMEIGNERVPLVEAIKEGPEFHASGEQLEMEISNERVLLIEAKGTEQASTSGSVPEVNCILTADAAIDSSCLNETGDVVPGHIDASCQLLDERCDMQTTREDASTAEDACGAGIRDQEGVDIAEKLDSDEKLDAKCLSEVTEGVDQAVLRTDFQVHCSSPVYDVGVTYSVPLEAGACPMPDQVMVGFQLDECVPQDHCSFPVQNESFASDQRHDGSDPTSNNLVSEDLKLDSLCSVEADLSSQNTIMTERENLECCDADNKMVMDSLAANTDNICTGEHAEFEIDAIEHDTDFLNVDDDDAVEDYESDMPNAEEKRILDNTGWSARTRAVANYLQVLFEKEAQHGKEEQISLDSLLAGKSRKEASRMFFETLVLKTKDYIHAGQESSFCDIRIKPRGKLMKSEF